uniref:Uncharacterized protein n=1 Tax=Rhizophora mucronata TaxID=61149 RepID=A0A2P2IP70_RHIMU
MYSFTVATMESTITQKSRENEHRSSKLVNSNVAIENRRCNAESE